MIKGMVLDKGSVLCITIEKGWSVSIQAVLFYIIIYTAVFSSFPIYFFSYLLYIATATIAKKRGPPIIQMVSVRFPSTAGSIIVKKLANPTVKVTNIVHNQVENLLL